MWICPWPNGHLQASGRDARGRKQYRYHAAWQRRRGTDKFDRMLAFAEALPRIRRRCDADLAARGLPREKVLAAVVRLLELTLIRVGNDEYARLNRSFGLTTLRDRHARIDGSSRPLPVPRQVGPLARGRACATGAWPRSSGAARSCPARSSSSTSTRTARSATSRRTTSTPTSAKRRAATSRPRTSGPGQGRCSPIERCAPSSPVTGERAAQRNVVEAIRQTADQLGNTPAVARGSYVHPAVLEAYLAGSIRGALVEAAEEQSTPPTGATPAEEAAVRALLRQRLEDDAARSTGGRQARRRPRVEPGRPSSGRRLVTQAADS